jgi:hypothetical protein
MPVRRPSRRSDHIPCLYPSWLLSLVAYPAISGRDFDDLPLLVRVPVNAGTRSERNIGGCNFRIAVNELEVDVATERCTRANFGGLSGVRGRYC